MAPTRFLALDCSHSSFSGVCPGRVCEVSGVAPLWESPEGLDRRRVFPPTHESFRLLLLAALVGLFCGVSSASPTVDPTTSYTETSDVEISVTTESAADPPAVPEETATTLQVSTARPPVAFTTAFTTADPIPETDTPSTTSAAPPHTPEPVYTHEVTPTEEEEYDIQTEGVSEARDVYTEGPLEADVEEEVVIEDGLSSGQIVGIVIGALLAVVIVIAVVIAAVRRMGKYSP
ncbi:podoplanin [Pholidichthys leucotaenia]